VAKDRRCGFSSPRKRREDVALSVHTGPGVDAFLPKSHGHVLMHANEGQVHGVVIECLQCGAFNATDMLGAVP
jgi:hypothetical protein